VSKRTTLAGLVIILAASVTASASGAFSGGSTFWLVFNPSVGKFDEIDLELDLNYTLDDVTFSSESVIAYPGTWVWQAFSACGELGAHAFESNILFGASTAEYLYAEAIISLGIGGIDFAFHAAQLNDAVFGGPEGGWALRLSGGVGRFNLVSVTEFGATIEDDDHDGISIVHIATGLERHYRTDPRPAGEGFTGQKISLTAADIFSCSDAMTATVYASCDGFEYGQIAVKGFHTGVRFLTLDAQLRFELEEKALNWTPTLSLGEVTCVELYGDVDWDASTMTLDGIKLSGVELICKLGPAVVREVALFDLSQYVLTTEPFGSRVMEIDDALEAGYNFYPDYWELLSITVADDACCGESFSFLANAYFDPASSSLFDWAMLHIEASIPLAAQVDITLGMEIKPAGTQYIAFGVVIDW
jgi:hypothetical protein